MIRRIGVLGHNFSIGRDDLTLGIAAGMAILMAARGTTRQRPETPEQAVKRAQRTEREQWNHDVEQRKANKKEAKRGVK